MTDPLKVQQDYWNREADAFDRIYSQKKSAVSVWLDKVFRKDMFQRFAFTIEHCRPIEGRRFLDVGCGNGLYSIELARNGAERVVGIDIAEKMLDACRELAAQEGVTQRCSFHHTDLLAYEPGSTFDVAIGIGLFDYIADPLPVLKKIRQLTTGKVIASFPRFWTWRAPVRKLRLGLRGCPVYFFTRRRLRAMFADAGFASVNITRVGKLHCVVATCEQ